MDAQVHEQVLKAGKKESGCTIHIVDIGVDTGMMTSSFVIMTSSLVESSSGPIVCQKKCVVEPNDTADTLKAKVQALEGLFVEEREREEGEKLFLVLLFLRKVCFIVFRLFFFFFFEIGPAFVEVIQRYQLERTLIKK